MMRLWEAGPQRQVDLLSVLDCDAATIARTVARLEHAGFVRRVPSRTDRRVTIVEPTAAGLALRSHVERLWQQLEETTVGSLDGQERADVLGLLQRLEAQLLAQRHDGDN
jgi:DNA-binding MarR family transcriptional regulator